MNKVRWPSANMSRCSSRLRRPKKSHQSQRHQSSKDSQPDQQVCLLQLPTHSVRRELWTKSPRTQPRDSLSLSQETRLLSQTQACPPQLQPMTQPRMSTWRKMARRRPKKRQRHHQLSRTSKRTGRNSKSRTSS